MFIYVLVNLARLILLVLLLAMFIRSIISWFPIDNEGNFINMLYAITEPVIMPVRALLEKFRGLDSFPFDLSFFITFILILILYRLMLVL